MNVYVNGCPFDFWVLVSKIFWGTVCYLLCNINGAH